GPLPAARRESAAGPPIICVANNPYERILRPVLRVRRECQRGSNKDCYEKPRMHKGAGASHAINEERAYTTSTSIMETRFFRSLDRTSASSCLGSTPDGM